MPKIVTIAGGPGRSGSTLVGEALGAAQSAVFIGELRQLGIFRDRDYLCGCGEPARTCSFWQSVLERAVIACGLSTDQLLSEMISEARVLEIVFESIAEVTKAEIVVDSSKHPTFLRTLRTIDAQIVHLIRDSRAVAHSWQRAKPKPFAHGELMKTYGPVFSSALWSRRNIEQELIGRRSHVFVRVLYERICQSPGAEFGRLYGVLGLGALPESIESGVLPASSDHQIAGNPARFHKGESSISLDQAWQTQMPRSSRLVVTALSLPLLARYGYIPARLGASQPVGQEG